MKRKLFSMALASVLTLSLLLTFAVSALAASTISIDKTNYAPGEEITVTLTTDSRDWHADNAELAIKVSDYWGNDGWGDSRYLNNLGEGTIFTIKMYAPDDVGSYEMRWYPQGIGNTPVVSVPFTVSSPGNDEISTDSAKIVPDTMAPALTANPTASTVLVNGENISSDAYNINDNNYFKLRDLAYILSGTEVQFEVAWDGANNAISLISGQPYTAVGGEMQGKGAGSKTPTATTSKILLDGDEVTFTAYNIEGNNYFKLRDIGQAFDFGVDWDGANNTIVIDTSKGYTP